jgi:hypothetical protein
MFFLTNFEKKTISSSKNSPKNDNYNDTDWDRVANRTDDIVLKVSNANFFSQMRKMMKWHSNCNCVDLTLNWLMMTVYCLRLSDENEKEGKSQIKFECVSPRSKKVKPIFFFSIQICKTFWKLTSTKKAQNRTIQNILE